MAVTQGYLTRMGLTKKQAAADASLVRRPAGRRIERMREPRPEQVIGFAPDERDEQPDEEVVAPDLVVGEVVCGRRHDQPGLGSGQVPLAEEEVREREREHERDDPGEDHPERAPSGDPAQETTYDRRADRSHDHAHGHRERGLVDQDHRAVAADPSQGADAQEQLVRAPEDEVEAHAVRGEHERLDGQRRRVRRVPEPDRRENDEDSRQGDNREKRPGGGSRQASSARGQRGCTSSECSRRSTKRWSA